MKVLFVVSDSTAHGGTEILTFNLMRELQNLGIDCYLISRYIYNGENSHVLNMTPTQFSRYQRLLNNPLNKLLGNKLSDNFLKKVIRKIAYKVQVDWIINHTYDLCSAIPTDEPWKTAQVFHWSVVGYENNLKSVIHNKSFIPRTLSMGLLKANIKKWHKSIPHFDNLICLTNSALSEIQNVFHLSAHNKIALIPDPLMQSQESTEVSSLNNKTIVYVGRLSHEKGVMRLLRIWKHLSPQLVDYTLTIYGDGYMQDEMKQFIKSNNLPRIELKGFSSDLKNIYTHADLCLMTSDTEGFGMVLIEAMYYGVPCISFDCPISPKEIIADAGLTVKCFDEIAYANVVVELLKNKEKVKYLQQAAIDRAKDFYINKVTKLWQQMLNSKNT